MNNRILVARCLCFQKSDTTGTGGIETDVEGTELRVLTDHLKLNDSELSRLVPIRIKSLPTDLLVDIATERNPLRVIGRCLSEPERKSCSLVFGKRPVKAVRRSS